MLDTHCHLDLYAEPATVADRAERAGVFTIVVTNLPSAFERSRRTLVQRQGMRLALGLHPLLADQHASERERFRGLLPETSFIGEVGLDFSTGGKPTPDVQIDSFDFVLRALGNRPKFVSVHSRRAEAHVIQLLKLAHRSPAVFHWYSGSIRALEQALADGHYFSVNPAMVRSHKGTRIIAALPRHRVLTETDGPFVKVNGRAAEPADVLLVENALAGMWRVSRDEVTSTILGNFRTIINPIRLSLLGARA